MPGFIFNKGAKWTVILYMQIVAPQIGNSKQAGIFAALPVSMTLHYICNSRGSVCFLFINSAKIHSQACMTSPNIAIPYVFLYIVETICGGYILITNWHLCPKDTYFWYVSLICKPFKDVNDEKYLHKYLEIFDIGQQRIHLLTGSSDSLLLLAIYQAWHTEALVICHEVRRDIFSACTVKEQSIHILHVYIFTFGTRRYSVVSQSVGRISELQRTWNATIFVKVVSQRG